MQTRHSIISSNIQYDASDNTPDESTCNKHRIQPHACSVLFKHYERELFNRCKYRLGNTQDAEDAVQETLLRAFKAIEKFEGKSSLRTWLYAIADNQCSTLAGRRMRHMLSEHVSALIEIHERSTRYQEEIEDIAQVNIVLNEMSANTGYILKMRYYMELSLEDIAQNLGIGLSAAKMRLYRAHDTFKQHYHESIVTG
jgi:RNA polymerase sigma-70 factor (ECF subfamily)